MPHGTAAKPTLDQLEHIKRHHVTFEIGEHSVVVKYVCSCGEKPCPVPQTLTVYVCPKPPCGGTP